MHDEGMRDGLKRVRLGELGSFIRGRGGTKADESPDGVPCVRYGDLYTEHDGVIRDISKFIAHSSVSRYTPLLQGDVVFAASGETHEEIGKGAAYCGQDVAYAGGDTIILRRGKSVDAKFLGYAVSIPDAERFKARYGQGSSVIHISAAHLSNLPLVLPTLPEQRRIAEILDTLDEAIRKTEQVIAKLQQMKQGLLHDLLTRGIDENGELRDPERHPEQFKDSPLGRITKEWEVRPLEEWVRRDAQITYGIVQAGPHVPGGIPYIRTGDMSGKALKRQDLLCTSSAIANSYRRSTVRTGEIVCAIRATVGRVLAVPAELDGANLTQGTARISPGRDIEARFLLWAMRGASVQRQIEAVQKGTTFQEITLGQLRGLGVAAPMSRSEQIHVSGRLDAFEISEEAEATELAKLRTLKHGLMDDLLTGRVRVSVPKEAAA